MCHVTTMPQKRPVLALLQSTLYLPRLRGGSASSLAAQCYSDNTDIHILLMCVQLPVQYSTVQCSTVQCSTVQVLLMGVQLPVQYSAVQYRSYSWVCSCRSRANL